MDKKDMNAAEMAAYIQGMIEGYALDQNKPEIKVMTALAEAIKKLSCEISELSEESKRVDDYLDELDHDLGDLESDFYEFGDDDWDSDDWDDWDFDGEDDFTYDELREPIILDSVKSEDDKPAKPEKTTKTKKSDTEKDKK